MGVKGLWSLLNPVARPVQIESLEGKRLAIDSSIWLYQFQATMRDKDGRVLVNAHVLGFLRRINKLLFHGIKPVFVFDGGAPALKRATIAERKRRKLGASLNHAKMAERLFAAQMRREAVKVAQQAEEQRAARAVQRAGLYDDEEGERIPENAVYLEDLEGHSAPRPSAHASTSTLANSATPSMAEETPEQRRKRFKKHDRYYLPETEMPSFSTEDKPDARLATEEELKQFIEEVAPEDIDVESAEFQALPTEVQYEIIGDLRVRSRQQSHKRLTDMLRAAPTALDFSKAQIKHLSQRNSLTQQLLTVTDMVSKAHLTIPVRVASERNREYVLVKRTEDEGGGWALGIREGTKEKPIVLEPETEKDRQMEKRARLKREEEEDSDSSIDEIEEAKVAEDEDLRQHRRQEILQAIARRYAPVKPARTLDVPVKSFGKSRRPGAEPLFSAAEPEPIVPTANDEALALALQQEELGSDEDEADPELAKALALSRKEAEEAETTSKAVAQPREESDEDDLEEVELVPSGTATPTSRPVTPFEPIEIDDSDDEIQVVEAPPSRNDPALLAKLRQDSVTGPHGQAAVEASDEEFEVVGSAPAAPKLHTPEVLAAPVPSPALPVQPKPKPTPQSIPRTNAVDAQRSRAAPPAISVPAVSDTLAKEPVAVSAAQKLHDPIVPPRRPSPASPLEPVDVPFDQEPSDDEGEPIILSRRSASVPSPSPERLLNATASPRASVSEDEELEEVHTGGLTTPAGNLAERRGVSESARSSAEPTQVDSLPTRRPAPRRQPVPLDSDDEDDAIEWSRSPTPVRDQNAMADTSMQSFASERSEPESDGEMQAEDVIAEEDDYARFMAQIKNRDLNEVRTEIDDEIRILNQQTKVAMRDSDEITQSMVTQIQTLLRHFGIPYITAPMEAEAQCAKLAELELVDGVITDDSDVFLFGASQCYKNIFNDAKYAECFASADVEREISLTRERLISLSYILGSDYTIGLRGVGPVMALELLGNFPGPKGLEKFKNWWMKVQRGQDLPVEADTDWKRRFKKRFAGVLFLTEDWLNPHVREAYLYPQTDESTEPFHWGFPRLAALRTFLHEELSWSISKVDDELTPIVQRIAQRGRGGLTKQATLLPFFDHSAPTGNYVPRRRTTANISKRLLTAIKQYREAEALVQGQRPEGLGEMLAGVDVNDPRGQKRGEATAGESAPKPKRRRTTKQAEEAGETDESPAQPKPKRKRASRVTATAATAAPTSDT